MPEIQPNTEPVPQQPNVPSEPITPGKPSPHEDQNLSGNESEANPGQLGNSEEVNLDPSGPNPQQDPSQPH